MLELDLSRWSKVWLSKPWKLGPDPVTGMLEVNGVRGYLVPGDVAYLFNLAASLSPGGNYLEVGSWMGLSSIVFATGLIAALNFRATVYCVDTWRGSPEHQDLPDARDGLLFDRFLRNVSGAGVEAFIRPVRAESVEAARAWAGPPLDLVFIDGDHSAEACYQDICHWHARLGPGGRLLGHDAAPGSGVEQALRRYCAEEGCRASVCPLPQCHYIWELHAEANGAPPGHYLLR
jgi:predicted O-methyltransferase YrrM